MSKTKLQNDQNGLWFSATLEIEPPPFRKPPFFMIGHGRGRRIDKAELRNVVMALESIGVELEAITNIGPLFSAPGWENNFAIKDGAAINFLRFRINDDLRFFPSATRLKDALAYIEYEKTK